MKYVVYENRKPCIIPHIKCWRNNKFDSFADALSYALCWCGVFVPSHTGIEEEDVGKRLYFYEGCYITIEKEE